VPGPFDVPGCGSNVPCPLPVGSIGGERMACAGGGWPRPDLEGPGASWSQGLGAPGERRQLPPPGSRQLAAREGRGGLGRLAGGGPLCVCGCVPLRIELGPRNVCARDSRPARVGESVWDWSSTVDVVDGMAWRERLRGDVGSLALLSQGRGCADAESMVVQRSGSGGTGR
jgi:hypothetical protein